MYRLLSNISSQQAKERWITTTVKLATLEMLLPTLAAAEDSSTDPARSTAGRPSRCLVTFSHHYVGFPQQRREKMDWILLVIIVGYSASDRAVNSATVPMATVERCNSAKDKLVNAIKVYDTPNYMIIAECLQSR
jgi:hypothetical protein